MAKRAKQKVGGTPALVALAKAGIAFDVREYEHDPEETDFGDEAARELGADPGSVFKTLLVDLDGKLVVAVVPVSGRLDLKALASALGGKRASMADPSLAERKTGYVVGGISPIGQKTALPTVLDESARGIGTMLVSGGRRGLDIALAPMDLAVVTRATWGCIAAR